MDDNTASASQPLSGVRVIEFCNVAAGPFCGMLLADFGADVIKVESPQGDALRQWPPITKATNDDTGFSENFASVNRNKRSIALNLKDPTDKDIAKRLIRSAAVVIENNRPGVMKRLGLGYEAFASERPDLIYCSMSAFGQEGPRAQQGGFDVTIQAISGIMSVTGEPDGQPVKCGVPISDFAAGLYAAFAVSSLLARVKAGGPGGYIDVPMMGTSLAIAALQTSEFFGTGNDPQKLVAAHPRNAPYDAFRASDGYFILAAGNDKLWRSVCETVNRPDLIDDPRFLTTTDRAANQAILKGILEEVFTTRTVKDWLQTFEALGVPCSPINSYSNALSDEHAVERGWVRDIVLPNGVSTQTFTSPIRIDGTPPPLRSGPPALDTDRAELLKEIFVDTSSRRPD